MIVTFVSPIGQTGMKKIFCTFLLTMLCSVTLMAQLSPETIAKRQARKHLVVREWNTDAKGNNGWLDHITRYDDQGRKIEEIEYATYGMVERVVSFYEDDAVGKVTKEEVYDSRNKLYRIRIYKYDSDGARTVQYNYMPNGKLYSIKKFEYTFETPK